MNAQAAINQEPYSVSAIANYFLKRSRYEAYEITNLSLQKIIYISYGWGLAFLGREIFDARIEAWQLGPVIPDLYHEFKRYGNRPIRKWSIDYDYKTIRNNEGRNRFFILQIKNDDDAVERVLNFVWNKYSCFSANELVNLTHEDDTPWTHIFNTEGKYSLIPKELIQDHFDKLYQELPQGISK